MLTTPPPSPTPEQILMAFLDPAEVRRQVRGPNPPERILLAALNTDEVAATQAARHPEASTTVLESASRCRWREVRTLIARRDDISPNVLGALITDRSKYVRLAVARNPATTIDARSMMAKDPEPSIRIEVARHPLNPDAVEQLSRDRCTWVLGEVARRTDLTIEQIERLSRSRFWTVRAQIAVSCNRAPTLIALAGDTRDEVRAAVAQNRNTPEPTLIRLAHDHAINVRVALAKPMANLSSVAEVLMGDREPRVRRELARWTRHDDALIVLADDKALEVRRVVAANEHTPPRAHRRLLQGKSADVSLAVINNVGTPDTLIQELQASSDHRVRKAARQRLIESELDVVAPLCADFTAPRDALLHWADVVSSPTEMAEAMTDHRCPPEVAVAILVRDVHWSVLRAAAFSRHEDVRRHAAWHRPCPPEVLSVLGRDRDPRVRMAVARNPDTDDATRAELMRYDPRAAIREAARSAFAHAEWLRRIRR
jgi:hypothetical protein